MRFITPHALRKEAHPAPLWRVTAPVSAWTMAPGLWRDIPGLADYAGTVVCEKTVTCAGTLRFVFGGVKDAARVWLDDRLLCEHAGPGAFDAVIHDVPWGAHVLRAEIDCDQPGRGGFMDDVTIQQMGSAYITEVTMPGNQVCVKVRSLSKKMQVVDVEARVFDVDVSWKKRLLPPGREITLRQEAVPDIMVWTPDMPKLYPLEAVLWLDGEPIDDLRDRMGISCAIVPAESEAFPVPLPMDALRAVQQARARGCRMLITRGAPDYLLDVCDQLGMPVWEELPGFRGNHPCVAGVGERR